MGEHFPSHNLLQPIKLHVTNLSGFFFFIFTISSLLPSRKNTLLISGFLTLVHQHTKTHAQNKRKETNACMRLLLCDAL